MNKVGVDTPPFGSILQNLTRWVVGSQYRQGKDRPHSITEKEHPVGLHCNLGRPRPNGLATNATIFGLSASFFLCHQDLNPGRCLPKLGSLPQHCKSGGVTAQHENFTLCLSMLEMIH